MKTYIIPLLCLALLGGCIDKASIGTVDFSYISVNSSKLLKQTITIEGYLATPITQIYGTEILEGTAILYETLDDLHDSSRDYAGVLLSVINYDVTSCNLLHVKATGEVIAEDRGRIFLKPTTLSPTKDENTSSCLVSLG